MYTAIRAITVGKNLEKEMTVYHISKRYANQNWNSETLKWNGQYISCLSRFDLWDRIPKIIKLTNIHSNLCKIKDFTLNSCLLSSPGLLPASVTNNPEDYRYLLYKVLGMFLDVIKVLKCFNKVSSILKPFQIIQVK